MNLSDLRSNLMLNISNFTNALNTARKHTQRFASDFASVARRTQDKFDVGGLETFNDRLHTIGLGLKDIARISSGIIVSQMFYGVTRSIREATGALWEFNESLDYANITYSSLFKSSNLAEDFLNTIKEFSVDTIFEYSDIEGMARKLSAYGIEYKNLMFIIEGLTNIGTISGDTAALERLAVAIGQINAKGTLKAEEMRQLANAYTPIYDILREKLHLTEEDLGRVGDLGIKSADAINAIIDYANETFGATADAAVMTITGLKNKIVDTLKVTGLEMIAPISTAYKSLLVYVSDGLAKVRDAFASGGWGGVLELLVPDERARTTIREFVANAVNLFMSLASVLRLVGTIAGNMFNTLVTAFNIITPVVVPVINTLTYFLNALLNTRTGAAMLSSALLVAAGAFVILRTQALYSLVINSVTKAIVGLTKAAIVLAGVMSRHPILALLSALGVGLIAVAANSDKAKNSLTKLMDGISGSTGGTTSKDVLQKVENEIEDNTAAAEQFNHRLEDGKAAAEDLEDAINGVGKSAKKANGLLSFDEVFKLPEESSGSGSGSGGALGAIDDLIGSIGDLSSNLGGALIPEIPDFSEFTDAFTDSLFGGLANSLSDKVKSLGIAATLGSILGGIIGAVLGGAGGAKIGMAIGGLAGGIVSWLWHEFDLSLNNTFVGAVGGIAKAIAKAFGGAVKELPMLLKSGSFTGFFKNLAGMLKATGAKNLLKGGLIGAAIGFVTDAIAGIFFDWLAESLELEGSATGNAKIGGTIGGIIGSIVGTFFGPVGTVVGSVLGTFAGGTVGLFWDHIVDAFSTVPTALITAISTSFGGLTGLVVSSYFTSENSEAINDWWTSITEGFEKWMSDTFGGLRTWWDDTWSGFSTWWTDTKEGFGTWWTDTKTKFSTWWTDTWSGFNTWWTDTKEGLSKWWSDTVAIFTDWDSINSDTLSNWWSDTKTGFSDWKEKTFGGLDSWWTDTKEGFTTWSEDTITSIATWFSDTLLKFSTWYLDTKLKFDEWFSDVKDKFRQWVEDVINIVVGWCEDTLQAFKDWFSDLKLKFTKWIEDTLTDIQGWADDAKRFITGFAAAAILAIAGWVDDTKTSIQDWITKTLEDFSNWATNATQKIVTWFTDMGKKIADWLSTTKEKIKSGWEAMFNPATWAAAWTLVKTWFSDLVAKQNTWFSERTTAIKSKWEGLFNPKTWKTAWSLVKSWFDDLFTSISSWFTDIGKSVSNWWSGLWDNKTASVDISSNNTSGGWFKLGGHASGGIFNREHIARFAEGNKAEAVIPLEDQSAMQPFVNAIADGILQGLMPSMATADGGGSSLPPMYVGTLVADDRGLEQLFKKFEVYEAKELARKGLA